MNKKICFRPIGVIHSPYRRPEDAPRRPCGFPAAKATVKVWARYRAGLKDVAGFSHVILVFHLHKAKPASLVLKPFLGNTLRGVFATRAPHRPNPIGISVVRLLKVRKDGLEVSHVDMVDGSPLLDIKPYIPETGAKERVKLGWLEAILPELDGRPSRRRACRRGK